MDVGASRPLRAPSLQVVRTAGQPPRGVGLTRIGADGPPPPSRDGAVSAGLRMLRFRGGASAIETHPGVQGTAANPPKGRHVDVRA